MIKQLLEKQIEFEYWSNVKILASLNEAQPLDDRAQFLFAHILNSSNMWLCRVVGSPMKTTLFQERTLDDCEAFMNETAQGWSAFIAMATDADFDRIFQFVAPIDGIERRISVSDAIMHISHHSSYHRGQIVTRLKGSVEKLPFAMYMPFAGQIVTH